jgi:hypothetical protein
MSDPLKPLAVRVSGQAARWTLAEVNNLEEVSCD